MEEKISVVIPNFNGERILAKNLPKVLDAFPKSEITVIDDASLDNSVNLIEKKFKEIKLIKNKKNLGFARSVNRGVEESEGRYVILLNSDVSPKKINLGILMNHFKDPSVFAVGFLDISHEGGKLHKRGRGGAVFQKGFLYHFALKTIDKETLWVSGGSGIFDKQKFLQLSGFDPVYAPFYWEDIDLSYRAAKKGYKVYFEPEAEVDHFHEEGAIKKTRSESFINKVSYKNQFLFVWKNIDDPFLIILHIFWLPYHFIKALVALNLDFFYGFIWALIKLPTITFSIDNSRNIVSDNEILSKFKNHQNAG